MGNIEVGGTGKSPFASGLAAALVAAGYRPVILGRGYGSALGRNSAACFVESRLLEVRGPSGAVVKVVTGLMADEARMVSADNPTVPVIIGRDRVRAYEIFSDFLASYAPTHVILDDGFQHWRIKRDVDVVLLSEGFAGDALLPAGDLREPVSALRRADAVVRLSGRDFVPPAKSMALPRGIRERQGRIVYGAIRPVLAGGLTEACGQKLPVHPIAFCGIARPGSFLKALGAAGVSPLRVITVKDHAHFHANHFTPGSIDGADAIVTTSKDYWRDPEIMTASGIPIWILPMKVEFTYSDFF
ncbi:MAG: tetraacyldisaccharide 4'-kinase [Proteobacteria bacterium]|nr:tetraacyldisaccharide 4'-kinase [Pseudomonadota bacterium]